MALIPKIQPKQEKKKISMRLDEKTHSLLHRYAAFLGGATYDYIIGTSLKRLFLQDKEFREWLEKIRLESTATSDEPQPASQTAEIATRALGTAS
jgi:hypothetical protein